MSDEEWIAAFFFFLQTWNEVLKKGREGCSAHLEDSSGMGSIAILAKCSKLWLLLGGGVVH